MVFKSYSSFIHLCTREKPTGPPPIHQKKKFWKRFPDFLEDKLGYLGVKIGTYPKAFIINSFIIALLFATGLQRLQFITDFETLFVPHGAQGLIERNIVESLFPLNYSKDYEQGYETRYLTQLQVIITGDHFFKDIEILFKLYEINSAF